MKHIPDFKPDTQPFPDDYGLGMAKVAEIRLGIAKAAMLRAAIDAFSTVDIPHEWRAMQRRLFDKARADYEAAKAVLS